MSGTFQVGIELVIRKGFSNLFRAFVQRLFDGAPHVRLQWFLWLRQLWRFETFVAGTGLGDSAHACDENRRANTPASRMCLVIGPLGGFIAAAAFKLL